MDRKPPSLFQPRHGKQPPSSGTALTAVAFQDHWVRMLSIGTNSGPRQIGLGPAARAKRKKDVRPVVDTGRSKPKPTVPSAPVEKEYVLDQRPPPLTLAQKFGLVEAPAQLLSEHDWSTVKAKSNARDDSKEPCVICKEDFGLQEQVLLSCSHVFHRACLQAFERYTGRKTCPMCRREQYQTRVIHEGAKEHRVKCATLIQAAWRGYVVRCWYRKLRQTVPPKDPKLRKKFYIDRLEAITDRIVKSCDFDVNQFLSEIETSLQHSRDIFRQFEALHHTISEEEWELIQLKAVERSNQDCPICLTSLGPASPEKTPREPSTHTGSGDERGRSFPSPPTAVAMLKSTKTRLPAKQKADSRINLPPIGNSKSMSTQKEEGSVESQDGASEKVDKRPQKKCGKPRKTVLLSCTHVFHETCLQTLEELAMGDIRNTCPVCRTIYQKRVISM
ncbi:hypothetical protein BaRGS_00013163 [Batillaria attramentaria]|uniref:RING-type domain-containing protein n=1 Tax=Batillaria attramentaria TaxID=370345 RepID=A0ABD0L842_9CAEN